MDYLRVLRLPQYFRNLQRLGEIARVLVKHGFGDLVARIQLPKYLGSVPGVGPGVGRKPGRVEGPSALDLGTRLRLVFEELGPTFIKFAQLIATRPDVFPEAVTDELRKLQDEVPPFPVEAAVATVREELGRHPDEIFEWFDGRPLAAASIAQVHRARLRGGAEVVVKIQRPHLDRILEVDTEILRGLAALAEEHIPESRQWSPSGLVEEFARSVKRERDFVREARSMVRFADTYAAEPLLVVPKVYPALSSRRVLTQQFVVGVRPDHASLPEGTAGRRICDTLTRVLLHSVFDTGFFHADPHPGNVLVTPDGKVALLDFGAVGRLDRKRRFEVLRFLMALIDRDLDRILRVLRDNRLTPPYFDETSLRTRVAELIDHYLGRPIGELDLSVLLGDVFEVVRGHGIRPPPDLLLVAKSITALQHIGASLDPGFDVVAAVRPGLLRRWLAEVTDPRRYARALGEAAESYAAFARALPHDLGALLGSLSRDEFALRYRSGDLAEIRSHQNKLVNRAVMTVIGSSVFCSGVYLLGGDAAHGGAATLLVAVGAAILALVWLAVGRSGGTV